MKFKKDLKITYENIMSYGFIAILTVFFLCSLMPDRSFSEAENRNLQTFPRISIDNIMNGQFQKQLDMYQSDQFVARNTWVHMKTKFDVAMGKKIFNGVYLGDDHQLFEVFQPTLSPSDIANKINAFAEKNPNLDVSMLLAPNPVSILADKLPMHATVDDQKTYIDELSSSLNQKIKWIPVYDKLQEHKEEYIYYKSDHHWTTLGAYYAFETLGEANGWTIKAEHWTPMLLSDTFNGTLAGKSSYTTKEEDEIYAYLPVDTSLQYVVQYIESQSKSTSMYKSENLDKRDQYSVFLDGNHPIIQIDTTSNIDKRLLIIKDSYANCMVPFLLPYYSKIVIVDPRYYNDDLQTLMDDNHISDVLFLFNANTFYEDPSLSYLLSEE